MSRRLDSLLRVAAARLADAGVASPQVDAEALLAHATGREPGELRRARILGEDVTERDRAAFLELVRSREDRVPLQHLTGTAHFAGVDLRVGPGVFVPRPETETLVRLAREELASQERPTVVDLCTGSGAVALALARSRPEARVGAVELSAAAHRYAATNVAALGLAVDLRQGRAQDAFGDWAGAVDLVTCNPPYIPPDAVPVDVEVREHDPELALYGGGEDGLALPAELAARAWTLLRPGGVLLMEHADVQGAALVERLAGTGWVDAVDHEDLAGRPRVVRATRPTG